MLTRLNWLLYWQSPLPTETFDLALQSCKHPETASLQTTIVPFSRHVSNRLRVSAVGGTVGSSRSRFTCAFSFQWLCSCCCCDGEVPEALLDSQHLNSCSSTKVPALDCERDLRGRCYISICQKIHWVRLIENYFSCSQWKIMTRATDMLPPHLVSGVFSSSSSTECCSTPMQRKTWLRQPVRRKCIQD